MKKFLSGILLLVLLIGCGNEKYKLYTTEEKVAIMAKIVETNDRKLYEENEELRTKLVLAARKGDTTAGNEANEWTLIEEKIRKEYRNKGKIDSGFYKIIGK